MREKTGDKKKSREKWLRMLFDPTESVQLRSRSISFGVFMAILPVWGFQFIIGMPLAIMFKMNKALFFLALHISMFPFTPLFWIASLFTGNLLMGKPMITHDWQHITLADVRGEGIAFFLGGTVLAVIGGLLSYVFSYTILEARRKAKYPTIAE